MKKVHWMAAAALAGLSFLATGKVQASTTDGQIQSTQNDSSESVNTQSAANADTPINKNGVVGIHYSGRGKVAVWNNYDNTRKITGKYLAPNTSWKYFKTATNQDRTWYNLGGAQWVSSEYAVDKKVQVLDVKPKASNVSTTNKPVTSDPNVANLNAKVTVHYSGRGKVAVWNNYDNTRKLTGNYVANGTTWKVFKVANNDGVNWYNLGGNQWITSKYTFQAVSNTNGNYKIYDNHGQVRTGHIVAGSQSFKADANGIIYEVQNNTPAISQLPELPTGCEMTATTMMLNYAGVKISKTQVANQTPRSKDGNKGFVGNPYSVSGWWVFPTGIAPVVNRHLGHSKVMTGTSLQAIKDQLVHGHLVVAWMANMHNFSNHAVTLTGYNQNGFFYNNPWTGKKESMSYSQFTSHWTKDKKRTLSY